MVLRGPHAERWVKFELFLIILNIIFLPVFYPTFGLQGP